MGLAIAVIFVFFFGGFIGCGIGVAIQFDWEAFFEYKRDMQEMRLKLATDYLDKEG